MSVATGLRVKTEEIKEKIGTRILNSKEELLSGELTEEINALVERRAVLVFPKVGFTDEEQIRFTDLLGGNVREIGKNGEGNEEVFKVTLDKKVNPYAADYLKGSLYWHIDGTMNPVPIRASMLTAKVLAPEGGDTDFSNTATAYEDLPAERVEKLNGMRVVHSLWISQLYHTPEPTLEQLEGWQSLGESELPLVVNHASGRKSLVLGNTAAYIKGLDPKESQKILHGLREFCTGEPYRYTHKWEVGDTVIWDNRTSLHRATPYDPECGRLMHRTILRNGEPWEQ